MSTKKENPSSEDFGIVDPGIERFPRLPTVPPSVAGTSTAAGAWGGGGDDGSDSQTGVGTSVGIGVGTSVGIGVGTSVGIGVGTSVGIGVGTSVGIGVGTSVGIGVGTSVGIGTGTSVGIGVGTSVGIGVGADLAGGGISGAGFAIDTAGAGASLRSTLLLARQVELLSTQNTKDDEVESDRLTARDLWKTVRIAQLAMSPCGEWVAFVKLERPSGGALQHHRIYLKRVGSAAGKDEFPLTDNTVLADTPVWKPNVFNCETRERETEGSSGKAEILFRARATAVDVLQLYLIEIDLPQPGSGEPLRVGRVRRLTNAPTHPWAPKWRRFKEKKESKAEHNRIYFVAVSPESPPVGYDHLIYDDALVGWWDNLRLPNDRWRFYEIDPYAPNTPRDLLGAHQPMLDFVYGVWNCWDVHPGGEAIVWTEVNRNTGSAGADRAPRWPNDIVMDIYRMQLPRNGASDPQPVKGLTTNIEGRGGFDDYMPMYSPDGQYIIYAEKQFSTLPADYPRIVRLKLDDPSVVTFQEGTHVFELISRVGDPDTILPLVWKFSGPNELVVLIEENGRHRLRSLKVSKTKIPDNVVVEPEDISNFGQKLRSVCCEIGLDYGPDLGLDEKNSLNYFADKKQVGGSVHDFDVKLNAGDNAEPGISAVVSGLNTPSELCFSPSEEGPTNFNIAISNKSELLDVREIRIRREQSMPWKVFGPSPDFVQVWLLLPSKLSEIDLTEGVERDEMYPLVQLLHGGPNSAWLDEFHMRFNASLLASQGYVVAMVNFRGSTGTPEGEIRVQSAFLSELKDVPRGDVASVLRVVQNAVTYAGKSEEEDKIRKDFNSRLFTLVDISKINKVKEVDENLFNQFFDTVWPKQEILPETDQLAIVDWGAALSDIDLVTKKLLEKGLIDKNRIAVIGGSYGAYLGGRLLGWLGERQYTPEGTNLSDEYSYKAYVLHAGVYDPLSHYATDAFWVQDDNFVDLPWVRDALPEEVKDDDPTHWEHFSRTSPLLRSQRLLKDKEKPSVLISHGLSDLRVHWQQSVLMHRMLLDRGVTSRLALYPGLGHRLDQPEPSVQWWSAALAWLDKNGVPPGPSSKTSTGALGM